MIGQFLNRIFFGHRLGKREEVEIELRRIGRRRQSWLPRRRRNGVLVIRSVADQHLEDARRKVEEHFQ